MKEDAKEIRKLTAGQRAADIFIGGRGLVLLLALILAALCVFSAGKVTLREGLSRYLPASADGGKGAEILNEEFMELKRMTVFLDNVSQSQCETVRDELSELEGVFSAEFDEAGYSFGRGIISLILEDETASKAVRQYVKGYDSTFTANFGSGWFLTDGGFDLGMLLACIALCAAAILVLVFASRSWADIPVVLIITALSLLFGYGTNFIFASLSRLTWIVSGTVQAVLTMYYSVYALRRYGRERKTGSPRQAAGASVSHSMPRILTMAAVSAGAVGALAFASNGLGREFALVAIKGIVISVLCTWTLLPCLITVFAKKIDSSRHKAYLPKIEKRGKFTFNTKVVFPVLFIILLIGAAALRLAGFPEPYAYYPRLTMSVPLLKNDSQLTAERAQRIFGGDTETVTLLIPSGDFRAERETVQALLKADRVTDVTGLTTVEAEGYNPGALVNVNQFCDLTGLASSTAGAIFDSYTDSLGSNASGSDGERTFGFIDIFGYTYSGYKEGTLSVSRAEGERLEEVNRALWPYEAELHGDSYNKLLVTMRLTSNTEKAAAALENVKALAQSRYDRPVYLTGDTGSLPDTVRTNTRDTWIIMVAMAALLLVVLTVVLRNVGQGAVITFIVIGGSVLTTVLPCAFAGKMLYTGPMLAFGVQAAVLAYCGAATAVSYNRYKQGETLRKGIGKAMKENYTLVVVTGAFTVLSGVIMALLGFDEGAMSFGASLGAGGIITLLLALAVIPQALVQWDIIVSRFTHTELELTNDKYRDDDIVAAFEQLKTDIDDLRKGEEQE